MDTRFRSTEHTNMCSDRIGVGSTISVDDQNFWLIFGGEGLRKVALLNMQTMEVDSTFIAVPDPHYLTKEEYNYLIDCISSKLIELEKEAVVSTRGMKII